MIQKLIVKLLKKAVTKLPSRTITSPDGRPYLTRWYVWPNGPRTQDEARTSAFPFAIFIHHFHRSDEDRDQHNHPWDVSVALVLAGGYHEERGDCSRIFRPGSINLIQAGDYHRVELLDPKNGSWSLFIAGRNIGGWGFRDEDTGEHIPHNAYFDRKYKAS